jgi:hypothetical protein
MGRCSGLLDELFAGGDDVVRGGGGKMERMVRFSRTPPLPSERKGMGTRKGIHRVWKGTKIKKKKRKRIKIRKRNRKRIWGIGPLVDAGTGVVNKME